ncbi:MAG: GNAT family N-acetyltransferase [Oscillospiraceae bacterium]|nr:GNAT family N-acetyltransferase [Oscillospiraceae bacterium]
MEIRHMLPSDDTFAISNIYEKSWKFAYSGIVPQSYLDSIPTGRWAESINGAGKYNAIIIENGEFIGTSSFCKSRFSELENLGEIVSLYLLPEYIGRGYGKKLMEYVVGELKNLGYDEVFLWVLEENVRALDFYERFGFVADGGVTDTEIGGKMLREIRYRIRVN